MKRILFRADANPSIGTGDLVSFIHLAQRFNDRGWESIFLIREYELGMDLIRQHFPNHFKGIDAGATLTQEINAINRLIRTRKIDALFFQINERSMADYTGLPDEVHKACVCFEYNLPKGYDTVLSWDADSDKYFDALKHHDTAFFLGPEYVILPKAYDRPEKMNRQPPGKRQRVLVSMGGADEIDMTGRIAEKLAGLDLDLDLTFVLGKGYQNIRRLDQRLSSSGLCFVIKQNVGNMLDEYLACDLAVGAGGLTASELVASRTPALLAACYEHQVNRCRYFSDKGWARYLGYRDTSGLNPDAFRFKPDHATPFSSRISLLVDHIDEAVS